MTFIRSKFFWLNVAAGAVAFLIIGFLIFKGFDLYTHRGQSIEVPDLAGLPLEEAKKLLSQKGFIVESVDSVYEVPPGLKQVALGSVVDQNPRAGEHVKSKRRFYLVIRKSVPPMVEMPDLLDLSLRQAISVIESRGLKFGKAEVKPGLPPVMKQLYNGKEIKPGVMIPKGSVINVWVGRGGGDAQVPVPNLIGLTYTEALQVLSTSNLNMGAAIGYNGDNNQKVVKQSPTPRDEPSVTEGSDIDVWLE